MLATLRRRFETRNLLHTDFEVVYFDFADFSELQQLRTDFQLTSRVIQG